MQQWLIKVCWRLSVKLKHHKWLIESKIPVALSCTGPYLNVHMYNCTYVFINRVLHYLSYYCWDFYNSHGVILFLLLITNSWCAWEHLHFVLGLGYFKGYLSQGLRTLLMISSCLNHLCIYIYVSYQQLYLCPKIFNILVNWFIAFSIWLTLYLTHFV